MGLTASPDGVILSIPSRWASAEVGCGDRAGVPRQLDACETIGVKRTTTHVGWILTVVGGLCLSCVPAAPPAVVTGPEAGSDLTVAASALDPVVFELTGVDLSAVASGGNPPYLYRWDQNAGPETLELVDVTGPDLSIDVLPGPGRYVFRVVVTDGDGFHATDYVAVEAVAGIELTASAPRLVVVGEPEALSAAVETDAEEVTRLWEVLEGDAEIDDPTADEPLLTTNAGETVKVRVTATASFGDDRSFTETRDFDVVSVFDLAPRVLIGTNFGDITIALEGELAPLHVANFLQYVDEGFYDGLLFHRNACDVDEESGVCEPFVLQGGGFERVDGELQGRDPTHNPVESEADNGLSNGEPYSMALALTGGDPNSGTTQFYVNLRDNSFLDDMYFTVFGRVVDGTDVVDSIVAMETMDSPVIPDEPSLPVEDVVMGRVARIHP